MATHKAVVLSALNKPVSIESVPTPAAELGSAIVRVLATGLQSYTREIFNGTRPYVLSLPLVPGPSCIGRIVSTGPDATALEPGQLVFCDPTITARDDADCNFLLGLHGGLSEGSRKLMDGPWRHGTYAEVVKLPLENCFPLDEKRLCGSKPEGLGYKVSELLAISTGLVPFGGLEEAGVGAGTTVIVAPATGRFSGAAVLVALAMGAKVIAAGRNANGLEKLHKFPGAERLTTVQLISDAQMDAEALLVATGGKGAQTYIDFSPPAAGANGTPSHITSCLLALKRNGTAMIMGGIMGNIEIPYGLTMFKNITIKGKFMYEREQTERFIRMVEFGNLKLGKESGMQVLGPYGLDDVEQALDVVAEHAGWGEDVVLAPNKE